MPIILRWKLERALLALIIVFIALAVGQREVLADYSQSDFSQVSTINLQQGQLWQYLGTGFTGYLDSLTWVTNVVSGNTIYLGCPYIRQYDSYQDYLNSSSSGQFLNGNAHITSLGNGDYSILCDGGLGTFNQTKYYAINGPGSNLGVGAQFYFKGGSGSGYESSPGVPADMGSIYYLLSGNIEQNQTINTPIFNVGNNSGNFNTRFISTEITGTSTNPKNVFVKVEYYIDPNELNRNVSATNPTQISLSFANRPNTTFTKLYFNIPLTTGTNTETFTIDDTNITDNGIFDLLIQYANAGVPFGSEIPFKDSYIYTNFTLTSKIVTATSTTENYNSTTNINQNLTSQPCGVTSLSGCISNAFSYLFIPNPTTLNNFKSIQTTLSTKFPFAYITDFQNSITQLYNENNTQNSSISVPFGNYGTIDLISKQQIEAVPFANWIKITLGYLLWIMFGFQMYRRTLNIFKPIPA